jgi:DNA/RNA-binding domain of Phe-tRNA-synthetase-like protein
MQRQYSVEPTFRGLGFPGIAVCEIAGIAIPDASNELEQLKVDTLAAVLQIDESAIADDALLKSYRSQVARIGRSAKKFPPAAESLIRLMQRTRRFPGINVAVDAYNITVCRSRLALGVHDLDRLTGTITFRLSPGGEPFRSVGGDAVRQTAPGDYLYADDARVLAWLDSKDSDDVKLSAATRNVLIVIQGTSETARDYTRAAIEDAAGRIVKFCGGTIAVAEL